MVGTRAAAHGVLYQYGVERPFTASSYKSRMSWLRQLPALMTCALQRHWIENIRCIIYQWWWMCGGRGISVIAWSPCFWMVEREQVACSVHCYTKSWQRLNGPILAWRGVAWLVHVICIEVVAREKVPTSWWLLGRYLCHRIWVSRVSRWAQLLFMPKSSKSGLMHIDIRWIYIGWNNCGYMMENKVTSR